MNGWLVDNNVVDEIKSSNTKQTKRKITKHYNINIQRNMRETIKRHTFPPHYACFLCLYWYWGDIFLHSIILFPLSFNTKKLPNALFGFLKHVLYLVYFDIKEFLQLNQKKKKRFISWSINIIEDRFVRMWNERDFSNKQFGFSIIISLLLCTHKNREFFLCCFCIVLY